MIIAIKIGGTIPISLMENLEIEDRNGSSSKRRITMETCCLDYQLSESLHNRLGAKRSLHTPLRKGDVCATFGLSVNKAVHNSKVFQVQSLESST